MFPRPGRPAPYAVAHKLAPRRPPQSWPLSPSARALGHIWTKKGSIAQPIELRCARRSRGSCPTQPPVASGRRPGGPRPTRQRAICSPRPDCRARAARQTPRLPTGSQSQRHGHTRTLLRLGGKSRPVCSSCVPRSGVGSIEAQGVPGATTVRMRPERSRRGGGGARGDETHRS